MTVQVAPCQRDSLADLVMKKREVPFAGLIFSVEMPMRSGAAIALAVLLSAGVAGQIATGRVLLAVVVDMRGQPLVDLGVDDFVVTEGSADREVLDVHVADYPIALLIDDSGSAADGDALRTAASRFIQRVGERPVLIGTFSSPRPHGAFSDDRPAVLETLAKLPLANRPPAPLLPTVAALTRALRDTEAPFSSIVVIGRAVADTGEPTAADLLPVIVETKAPIHVVAMEPAARSGAPSVLRALSEQTRGQYTPIFAAASFAVALDRLADRLSTEMMVEYLVPPDGRGGDVRVGVRRPGARVLGLGVSK
jgi:hypothetical protein